MLERIVGKLKNKNKPVGYMWGVFDPAGVPVDREDYPVAAGVLDYFPDAIREIARCSKIGNDQHNPGEPLHWAREKSTEHPDKAMRHFLERGSVDDDGVRHSAKAAWRLLALLQEELEACGEAPLSKYTMKGDPNIERHTTYKLTAPQEGVSRNRFCGGKGDQPCL